MANELNKPACMTCGGSGWIGGPSFYAPDEGGEECPDCSTPVLRPVQPSALVQSIAELEEWGRRADGEPLTVSESESVWLVLHELKRLRAIAELTALPPVAGEAVAPTAFQKALDIRIEQGWQLGGNACPVLYTDTINGQQVCRDDLWLATTAGLKGASSEAVAGAIDVRGQGDTVTVSREAYEETVATMTKARDLLRTFYSKGATVKIGTLYSHANGAAWGISHALDMLQPLASPDAGAGAVAGVAFYIDRRIIDPTNGRIGNHVKSAITWSNVPFSNWALPVYLAAPASAPEAPEQPVVDELAAFEAWGKGRGNRLDKFGSALGIWSYEDDETQAAFVAWRARAALAASPSCERRITDADVEGED